MAYRFREHTAELELELSGSTEAGVFEAALEALGELVSSDGGGTPAEHALELPSGEHALLLVDWLNELLFLAEVERFVPERLVSFDLSDDGLRSVVAGRRSHPRHLVKAATLNRIELGQQEGSWHARLVLDV